MGWFSNIMFGKTTNQVPGPKPAEHSVWGVEPKKEVTTESPTATEVPQPQEEQPPEILCMRVEPHISSDMNQLELWVCFHNASKSEVEITDVECLGQRTNPGRYLQPDQNHEVQVYRGPVCKNDAENKAYVTYKSIVSGLYYRAEYYIKYKYSQHEGSEHYSPYEFDLLKPIQQNP